MLHGTILQYTALEGILIGQEFGDNRLGMVELDLISLVECSHLILGLQVPGIIISNVMSAKV